MKKYLIGGKYMSTLIDSRKIGKTIKSLRKANNLTQSELADIHRL